MKRYITVFIFLLLPVFSSAQSDHDKDLQELNAFLFGRNLKKAKVLIENKFLKANDESRQVIGYVYLSRYYKIIDNEDSNDLLLKALQKAKEIADKTGKEIDIAYVEYGYAAYYTTIKQWDLYIKSLEKSIRIFKKHPNENFMLATLYHLKFSAVDQNRPEKRNFANYTLANAFAKQSKDKILISSSYNDIGNFYTYEFDTTQEKKYNDSAQAAYGRSFNVALQVQDPNAKKRLQFFYYTNIGLIYLNNKKYTEALANYDKGVQLYNENDKFYLANLYNNIGYTYALMRNNTTALEYYLKAESMTGDKEVTNILKITVYQNISEAYEKLHVYDKALAYEKKVMATTLEEDKLQYNHNTKSLETFYQTEQEKNNLAERNKMYQKYQVWYITAIAFAIACLFFLFFMLYYRQKLNKRTTSLLESERENLKMEHELSILKQEQLQKQALATSIQLEHKNNFINELKENVQKDNNLHHLIKNEQLVDNNFNTIRNIIQETHPTFFKRLNEITKTKLTNLDLKYAAYIYLNMDNNQIAAALKVDPKTVSVTKYRLKQKLDVDKNEDLNNFIRNLHT